MVPPAGSSPPPSCNATATLDVPRKDFWRPPRLPFRASR
jgi:hypothetical protein